MTIRKTLLEVTQAVLSAIDGQEVNSISDTDESLQIAEQCQNIFYSLVAARNFPEHREFMQVASLGDSTRPTVFSMDATLEGVTVSPERITMVQYNVSTDSTTQWRTLMYMTPEEFIYSVTDNSGTDTTQVTDVKSTATYDVWNNRMPSRWTSFDDEHIVMDGYDSSVESTLQTSKTRILGTVIPTLALSDSAVPDIDDQFHPLFLNECISTCASLYNEGADPKIEQWGRRLQSHLQNDRHRVKMGFQRPTYGRRK